LPNNNYLKLNNMKKFTLLSLIICVITQISFSQVADLYLGLTPPGYTPEIFAPGVVSLTTLNEKVITFSPSGHEIFFSTGAWPTCTTMYIEYKNNAWTTPVLASFSSDRSADEPFFSVDGSRIYFYAYQPGSSANSNIYYCEKSGDVWGPPVALDANVNTTDDQYHPNIVNDGSIYYSNGIGKTYRAQYSNGTFQAGVLIPIT